MWRKISFCFLFLLLINNLVFSKDSTNAFLDKVQKVIDVRRTFDSESEPKDPAIFTITKNSDEKTNYTIDLAILYKLFSTDEFYLRPVMQFYYSSSEKEPSERITGAWSAYWIFDNPKKPSRSSRSNRLESMVSYSKDFKTEFEKLGWNLVWVPTYPEFLKGDLPIQNATEIEYEDSGFDRNVLIHGFQPIIGLGYDKEVSDKGDIADVKSFRGIVKGQYSWRRYYFQLDLALNFENELIDHKRTFFDYSAKTSFYFDDKERSSINTSVEVIERPKIARNTKITFGFGLKL